MDLTQWFWNITKIGRKYYHHWIIPKMYVIWMALRLLFFPHFSLERIAPPPSNDAPGANFWREEWSTNCLRRTSIRSPRQESPFGYNKCGKMNMETEKLGEGVMREWQMYNEGRSTRKEVEERTVLEEKSGRGWARRWALDLNGVRTTD